MVKAQAFSHGLVWVNDNIILKLQIFINNKVRDIFIMEVPKKLKENYKSKLKVYGGILILVVAVLILFNLSGGVTEEVSVETVELPVEYNVSEEPELEVFNSNESMIELGNETINSTDLT